jgi:hypothetical protein
MGLQGEKGSICLKGNKGNRGYIGLQGPKGECIVDPKISIYPVSQEVFINTTTTFYCWVDGQTSKQITWSKLGGALSYTTVKDGALHINNVQRSHVGSYICTAYTGHGIFKAISNLHLKGIYLFFCSVINLGLCCCKYVFFLFELFFLLITGFLKLLFCRPSYNPFSFDTKA